MAWAKTCENQKQRLMCFVIVKVLEGLANFEKSYIGIVLIRFSNDIFPWKHLFCETVSH